MVNQFITNEDKLLRDVVNDILPVATKFRALVGYFYFSGFAELYQQLADKEVKILVGLEVDLDVHNCIIESEHITPVNHSRAEVRDAVYASLVEVYNESDHFDTAEKQVAFRMFLEKISNGSLEIKKTLKSNHAKMYIFDNKADVSQGGTFPGTVITGSSNLTRSGMKGQCEINVILRGAADYDEASRLFNRLWAEAVEIAGPATKDKFFKEVKDAIWLDKLPTPYQVYLRVLEEYFSFESAEQVMLPSKITDGGFFDLQYQIDAVKQALAVLERHNGVIIADVVGLGKSIIASVIAHNLGVPVIVIAPPHLKDQWEEYHNTFRFHARIFTSGKIEDAFASCQSKKHLIIIDEAHKYRNTLTEDYANLHKLCAGNKVVLLTATPFNNRPQDIFAMLRLFQIPAKSTIRTIDNLSYRMRELAEEYNRLRKDQRQSQDDPKKAEIAAIGKRMRDILQPLLIRRTRLDLLDIPEYRDDLVRQGISFPTVKPPVLVGYKLGELTDLYLRTLDRIAPLSENGGFIGARYKPTSYLNEEYLERVAGQLGGDINLVQESQANIALFMRRLLVRRFESSVCAFKSTLDAMIRSSEMIVEWYERLGKVPVYKKGKLPDVAVLEEAIENELQDAVEDASFTTLLEKHFEKGLVIIEKGWLNEKFIEHLKADIALLNAIRLEWAEKQTIPDPKLIEFSALLKSMLANDANRKIVVFTEFADTANYLYDNLKNTLRAFKYTSSDASPANKAIIRENFDAGWSTQVNNYDVLIATDAISEGYNLHRAGTVINYDIPYNPTRVIQRVGRINRINKKMFDNLYIYNFFPTAIGERETRIKQVATIKLALIHAILGEDMQVLTTDEQLASYFKEQYEALAVEERSWDTPYRIELARAKTQNADDWRLALKFPVRTRIRRTAPGRKGVIVFARKGREHTFKIGTSTTDVLTLSHEDALGLFNAQRIEPTHAVSNTFEDIYQTVKKHLFLQKTQIASDKGKKDTIAKLKWLEANATEYADYLKDLLYVMEQLDALPDRYAKQIRTLSEKTLSQDMAQLMQDVPHQYLSTIIALERSIDDGPESLIIAEELA